MCPKEVGRCLIDVPGVSEAAVFGVPDDNPSETARRQSRVGERESGKRGVGERDRSMQTASLLRFLR